MTEKQLYQLIRELLPGDFLRVENGVALGVPDINICHMEVEVWIEAKLTLNNGVLLRKFQYAWGKRRIAHGGRVFLIAYITHADRSEHLQLWEWRSIEVRPCGKYLQVISDCDRSFPLPRCIGLEEYLFPWK